MKQNTPLWVIHMLVVMCFVMTAYMNVAQAKTLGQKVTNIAAVTYEDLDGYSVTVLTNSADFIIEAKRTPSTVTFFRESPNASEAQIIEINGSDYSPSGSVDGPFVSMARPSASGQGFENVHPSENASEGDVNARHSVSLIEAHSYLAGEYMYVQLVDEGQNGDPNIVENVITKITTSSGDAITIRLYEDGPNTGHFWAFVKSSGTESAKNDAIITTPSNTVLMVTYTDVFDATEVSTNTVIIGSFGQVFNALSGEEISGVKVTLIDMSTNNPALVYGIDGSSMFPSEIVSGGSVKDESGHIYHLEGGEFVFPIVPPGTYKIQVKAPDGLSFASILPPEYFQTMQNGQLNIASASYGKAFEHTQTGSIHYDIPLDAESEFVLTMTASAYSGDIGDIVEYEILVENRGQDVASVTLYNELAYGLKYVAGSTRNNDEKTTNPTILSTNTSLNFLLNRVPAGGAVTIKYVAEIGAGISKTTMVNTVVARNGNGEEISNIARTRFIVQEDLMRSRSTIIGRIAENACQGTRKWARNIETGNPVENVRLYMENGAYAVSDQKGLFHFEGVKAGSHVVQMDVETLPDGYEVMVCEENSQYAGSGISKFVDVQGGGIWRANFYLKKTGKDKLTVDATVFNDQTEYKEYDANWLATQNSDLAWVYPAPKNTPSRPSVNIGIKHAANQNVSLFLNSKPVPKVNFSTRDANFLNTIMLSRWRGVDLLDGKNIFEVVVKNNAGKRIQTLNQEIYFVKNIARVSALPDQSVLVADGRTKPELALRIEDETGRPVHEGRIVDVEVLTPYELYQNSKFLSRDELVAPLSAQTTVSVGTDGIARILLEPTLKTGKVSINVKLDNGRKLLLHMYLAPEKRDWIIVGLAEGSLAHDKLSNKSVALRVGVHEGIQKNGRVAFFAKGLVKGNYLLTLAVDTSKRRGAQNEGFETQIDPNAYYTLYGDRSNNGLEAASQYPLYVKIEKASFYAMFGDFNTNITEGVLTKYSRHLSGIKSEYLGANFQAIAFAAETNQGFTKDEIAANGTSGPYQLSHQNVLQNSETITIETRDRVRSDKVLNSRYLIRHLDYTLDNFSGEIIFRLPVDVSDASFNPNVIVVDYETSSGAERNISYGGRVQTSTLRGKIKLGSTFVKENGSVSAAGISSDMIGVDLVAELSESTEVRVEYARSANRINGVQNKAANAYLAEVTHTSDKITADAYIRQEEGGFGLGQSSANTNDMRRYGANIIYEIQEFVSKKTGRRGKRAVKASYYQEKNLGTGDLRNASEISVSQTSESLNANIGFRQVKDQFVGAASRSSLLAIAGLRYNMPAHGASFSVSHEQPLSGKKDASGHPQRTRLGLDKTLTSKASVRITHDILSGQLGTNNTAIGVSFQPWSGMQMTAGSDLMSGQSSKRIGATFGLDQQFKLDELWSASVGLSNHHVLSQTSAIASVTPNALLSSLYANDNFMTAYLGVGYRTNNTSGSARVEGRKTQQYDEYILSLSAAREFTEDLSFAGAFRLGVRDAKLGLSHDASSGGATTRLVSRLGTSWRPNGGGIVLFDRFDMSYNEDALGKARVKLVNNFAINAQIAPRLQMSGNYGLKYVENTFGTVKYAGFSQVLGAETRFDITKKIDFGLHGMAQYSHSSDAVYYAYGPSVGVSPVDNVWLSLGYNLRGYTEDDFLAAVYSQKGVYMKFRIKFDQNSARKLLDMISTDGQ